MEFKVQFIEPGYRQYDFSAYGVGLKLIDRARQELNMPQLALKLINESVNRAIFSIREIEFELSEKEARCCGDIFGDGNISEYKMSNDKMEKFVIVKIGASRAGSDDQIKNIFFNQVIDLDALKAHWLALPLEDVNEEDVNENA